MFLYGIGLPVRVALYVLMMLRFHYLLVLKVALCF
jgi:hypothetical protein